MAKTTSAASTPSAASLLCLAALAAMAGGAVAGVVPLDGTKCPEGYFMCMGGEGCVPDSVRCDGTNDCADSTDEFDCGAGTDADGAQPPAPPPAAAPEAPADTQESMEEEAPSSENAAVEAAAGEAAAAAAGNATEGGCLPGEHRCLDGTCISHERICDGPRDCYDGSDEDVAGCASTPSGPVNATGDAEWLLPLSPFAKSGVDHLPSARLPRSCSEEEFQCKDGSCVPRGLICNERADCPDGSDETLACPPRLGQCKDDFRCADGLCLPFAWVCNNEPDCLDKSDEDPELCANWTMPVRSRPKLASPFIDDEIATSSGDPCEKMEPLQRQHCWEAELQKLKVEEMQVRLRVALQQLENAQMEGTAIKELRQAQLVAAQLQRQAADDLVQEQQALHEIRLQTLIRPLGNVSLATGTSVETTTAAELQVVDSNTTIAR